MNFIHTRDRIAGVAVPLLALRSTKNAASGVYSDLEALGRFAKRSGLSLIQLLPLNDTGTGTSPYSALSAFALNPIYISLSETPNTMAALGLPFEDGLTKDLERAAGAIDRKYGGAKHIPYEAILRAKLDGLRAAWRESRDICEPLAEALAAEQSWAKPYACFVALKAKSGGDPWWDWPEHRDIEAGALDELWFSNEIAEEARFSLWLQVIAREQLRAAAERVRDLGVDIMGDIPILLARDSADVWFRRDIFILDRQAGAPPDMYSPRGQNWGFPLYNWDALGASDYDFWRDRLAYADQFYTSYRIDHVLGFFRIWAIDGRESDAYLGTFEPSVRLSRGELTALGFSDERLAWLSKPHIPEWKIQNAERACLERADGRRAELSRRLDEFRAACFQRIASEPLFFFGSSIRGSADIYASAARLRADFPEVGENIDAYAHAMADWWIDRALYETEPDAYVFQWTYRDTTSWKSLSAEEQSALASRAEQAGAASLEIWERRGRELLSMLISATGMQPFAEDLGAVPVCVPKVLRELEIPGLRVLRWERNWGAQGQPYIPLEEYEPLSVACTSVHDSTNIRQWWEEEADRPSLWAILHAMADRDTALRDALGGLKDAPAQLSERAAAGLVRAVALSSSVVAVYPLQDLLACSSAYRDADPRDERINTPGTTLDTNWTYRMPADIRVLSRDVNFCDTISAITARGATV